MTSRLLLLTAGHNTPAGAGLGSEDERHLSRYTTEQLLHRRARFLLARGLELLAPGRSHAAILFSGSGKPVLSLSDISFSFSYTQKPFCLLCKTDAQQAPNVGLDCLEVRKSFLPPVHFFSADEKKQLRSVSTYVSASVLQCEVLRRFCIYEAVLKAHGTGLAHIPATLHAGWCWQRHGEVIAGNKAYAWRVLTLAHTYVCLAIDTSSQELLYRLEVHRV